VVTEGGLRIGVSNGVARRGCLLFGPSPGWTGCPSPSTGAAGSLSTWPTRSWSRADAG